MKESYLEIPTVDCAVCRASSAHTFTVLQCPSLREVVVPSSIVVILGRLCQIMVDITCASMNLKTIRVHAMCKADKVSRTVIQGQWSSRLPSSSIKNSYYFKFSKNIQDYSEVKTIFTFRM